jgi:hypothetical protein
MLPFLPLEAEHELIELVLPVWAFPAIAAAFFALITVISWSYRDVAHRHHDRVSADSQDAHH